MDIQSEIDRIQAFVEGGNYHAAINIAISCMNECRRNNDQSCVDVFLGVIREITQAIEHEFGSKEYLEKL